MGVERTAAAAALTALFCLPACLPGGIIDRGGPVDRIQISAQASLTRGAPYNIICPDEDELRRRETLPEEERRTLAPALRYVPPAEYRGGCEVYGESSVFFLFNLWPATPSLDPQYAIATAVQSVEGDSMINIRLWHELHYYSLLGRVAVLRVKGDAIKYLSEAERKELERNLRRTTPAGRGGRR